MLLSLEGRSSRRTRPPLEGRSSRGTRPPLEGRSSRRTQPPVAAALSGFESGPRCRRAFSPGASRAQPCAASCGLTSTRGLPAARGAGWDGAVLSDGSSVTAGAPGVGLGFPVDLPGPASRGRSRQCCQLTAASHCCVA
ncbi:unnamed protein product [Rangifer tarandus platyrhynchus]|uniref:Uncharacterized protein n=1 Tax=Rangifer tarandus platyrhynchus TaxID=3082113 RepID=A0AC59ZWL8_RANTA